MRLLRFFLGLLLLMVCLFATGYAQDDMNPFTLYDAQPVISHSTTSGDWDDRYTDPGAAFYHDGQFHMFRNGFRGWPASVQIGYLTSEDGLEWTEVSEDPVLLTDEVPYTDIAALASSALVEEDGTWVIYFYTWNNQAPSEIGRATAADPLGPWEVSEAPVLTVGGEGEWDADSITAPSVVRTDDGYVMYYSGSLNRQSAIGMATSEDGITWTKYDDPDTTEAPFAESDPVLVSMDENMQYHQPRVEKVDDGYAMIYRTLPVPPAPRMGLGIAKSVDGIEWEVLTPEPFWDRSSIPRSGGFWFTATVYHDGTLYLYIEGGRGRNTDIYVATSNENFPW